MGSDPWSLPRRLKPDKECCFLTWIHFPVASLSDSIGIVSPGSPWSWLKPSKSPFGDLRVNPRVGLGCTFTPPALIWNFWCYLTTVFFWFGTTSTWSTATIIDHANYYIITGQLALYYREQTFYSPTITHFLVKKPIFDPWYILFLFSLPIYLWYWFPCTKKLNLSGMLHNQKFKPTWKMSQNDVAGTI